MYLLLLKNFLDVHSILIIFNNYYPFSLIPSLYKELKADGVSFTESSKVGLFYAFLVY